jgi:hypothetical protein
MAMVPAPAAGAACTASVCAGAGVVLTAGMVFTTPYTLSVWSRTRQGWRGERQSRSRRTRNAMGTEDSRISAMAGAAARAKKASLVAFHTWVANVG